MQPRSASNIALVLFLTVMSPAVIRAAEAVARETYRTRVAASLTPERLVATIEGKGPGQVREMFGDASSFLKDTVGTTGLVVDIGSLGSLDEITDSFCGGIAQVSDGKPLQAKSKLDAAAFWLSLATDLLKAKSGEDVNKALNTAAVEWGWNKATGAASSVFGGLAILPANLVRWFLSEVKSSVDTGVEAQLWKQYLEACSDLLVADDAGRRAVGRLIVEGRLSDELLRRFDEDMYLMAGSKGLAGWDAVALSKRHREAFRDKFLVENKAHLEAAALGELQRSVQAQLPALKEALGARLKQARSLFEKPLTFRYRPVDGLTKEPVTRSLTWQHEANPDHRGGGSTEGDGQARIRTASSLDVYPGDGADELVLILMAPGYLPHRLVVPVSWREALDRKVGQDLGQVVLKPAASGTLTVTVTSSAPSERDRFSCSLGSAAASALEKDEKAGRFGFRVVPGTWLVIVTEGNHGAAAREVVVADGAKLEISLELERLPAIDADDPARDQLPAVLPPSSSSSTAAAEVREALRALAGPVEGGVEAVGPRAVELVTQIHEAVAPHQSGRVMAQMERWQGTLTGDALQAWWAKRGNWVTEYTAGLKELASVLEEESAAAKDSGEEGIRRQNEVSGRFGRLRSSLRRPPQWDSVMPLFLPGASSEALASMTADPTPGLKASLMAEVEATCVDPATLSIYELRRVVEGHNPFASRLADAEREAGNAADARTRATTAVPELDALSRELDENLAAHGLAMVVSVAGDLPRSVDTNASQSKYRGGSRTRVVRADCGSTVRLTTSLRGLRDEVAALLAFLGKEADRRTAHRDALREASASWGEWQGRVRARLAAEEAEEARIHAELERLAAEVAARAAALQKLRDEVGARVHGDLRRRSGAVEALKPGPTKWSLEQKRQAVEVARDSAFIEASTGDLGRLRKAIDGLEATNAALNDLMEVPAYARLSSRPSLPEARWGRETDGYRSPAITDARRLASEGRVRLLNVALARRAADETDGAVTTAAVRDGEYMKKLGEGKDLLERLRVASADLDAFARAWTAEVERDHVEPLRALLTEVAAATVGAATRELAVDVEGRLRDFDHLRSAGLGGAFHRWYQALADEYRSGKTDAVMRRIDEGWTSPGGGSRVTLERGLAGLFAAGPVASCSFVVKDVKLVEGDSRRMTVTYEARTDHRPAGVGRGTEKSGTVTDVVVLRPDGARIASTAGDVWAVAGEGATTSLPRLSHCQFGYAPLGGSGQERLVPVEELRGGKSLVLAGIAAGGRFPILGVRVSLDGGATFADAAMTAHGNRVVFSLPVPLSPGVERGLVLEARSAGGVVRYPPVDSVRLRCVDAPRAALAASVAAGLVDAWKGGEVGAVAGYLADGLWSGRDELLEALGRERLMWKVEGLATDSVAAGPAGPQTRVRLAWRGRYSPRSGGPAEARGGTLDLYLDGGLRVTDLRGDLPFAFTSAEQVESARYSLDASTLRGRLRVDHGTELDERDRLRLGILFEHGLVMPIPSADTERVDVALGLVRIFFSVPFGIAKAPGSNPQDVKAPPSAGYSHAVFRLEPGAMAVAGCRGSRWAAFQLLKEVEGDPGGELTLRYVYHADRATLPYTKD